MVRWLVCLAMRIREDWGVYWVATDNSVNMLESRNSAQAPERRVVGGGAHGCKSHCQATASLLTQSIQQAVGRWIKRALGSVGFPRVSALTLKRKRVPLPSLLILA